jgi:site-specific DNA recombinase
VIYCRISQDVTGERLGVERQESACRELAQRNHWTVTEVYVDNDISAFSGKGRPEYDRLLRDIQGSRVARVLAWHPDRLTRRAVELERLIDLLEASGCEVSTVQSGRWDLGTPTGRMQARIVGAVAQHESEHKSQRMRAALRQKAEAGKPHMGANRPYGWLEDRVTPEPSEAAVVREATRMLLAGNSMKAVVRSLNAAGSCTATGLPWRDVTLRGVVLRQRNAGRRTYKGAVVGLGIWEPIVDPNDFDALRLLLSDPGRCTNPGRAARKHLLSVIGKCGICGGPLASCFGKAYKGRSERIYRCKDHACTSRSMANVDQLVRRVLCARLSMPDAADLLVDPAHDPSATHALKVDIQKMRARLEVAAGDFADGAISQSEWVVVRERLTPRLATAEARLPDTSRRKEVLGDLVASGEDVEQRWDSLDISVQRQVVALLLDVELLKTRSGPGFDPESVRLTWKAS